MLYLYFASWVWPSIAQRELSWAERHGPGDDIVWMMSAFPTLVGATILNIVVSGWVAWRRWRLGTSPLNAWAWCIPALWVVALLIDGYRQ